jgi:hypothetical protein
LTHIIDVSSFSPDELVILTDFLASCGDLKASLTDNSSKNAHAMLAIFVVLHSRKEIRGTDEKGCEVTKMVNQCDVWHFLWRQPPLAKRRKMTMSFTTHALTKLYHTTRGNN